MNTRNTTNFPSMISELKLAKNAAIEAGKIINNFFNISFVPSVEKSSTIIIKLIMK